jgi:uncharacterized HhH-GPD family protein
MSAQGVAETLLEYGEKLKKQNVGKENDFVNAAAFPDKAPANALLTTNPFAFLLGVIYDQGQQAERGWYYPYQLQTRLGALTPQRIAAISLELMDEIFATTKPLLFYWRMASIRTLRAAYRVCKYYNGDTSHIWTDGVPSPREIQRRFAEFDGIGQKKCSMATNILYRDLKWISVAEAHLKEIDVSYDRHVRRVFLRTGLTDIDSEESIVQQARIMSPKYPGALDTPSWYIGRTYCSNNTPKCEQCPLSTVCAKRTQYTVT